MNAVRRIIRGLFSRGARKLGIHEHQPDRRLRGKQEVSITKFVNLTPHAINFVDGDGTVIKTVPSAGLARVVATREKVAIIDGIAVNKTSFGEITGLSEAEDGTIYIVSSLVAQACPERQDVFVVDDTVRDENGRIIGARAIAHI